MYAVVTVISSHRIRYAIPIAELEKLGKGDFHPEEWAKDMVACNELEEFSQVHLGESIVDTAILSEEDIVKLFDKDDPYGANWTLKDKLRRINNWQAEVY